MGTVTTYNNRLHLNAKYSVYSTYVHGTRVHYVKNNEIVVIVGFKNRHKKVKSNFMRTVIVQFTHHNT